MAVVAAVLLVLGATTTSALADPPAPGKIVGSVINHRGEPAANIFLQVVDATTEQFRGNAFTNEAGAYTIGWLTDRPFGDFKLKFFGIAGEQWAHQKRSFAEAETITVAPGEEVTVNEQLFPYAAGTVTFTATDKATGARLASFCADLSGRFGRFRCTDTGFIAMPDVPVGDFTASATGDDFHLSGDYQKITVTADQTTAVSFRLAPAGVVEATVTDAATNAPVELACFGFHDGIGGVFPGAAPFCTDQNGQARIDRVTPGTYRFFIHTRDGKHGSQWIGPHGGIGTAALAKTFTLTAGATLSVSARLDGAGSITGTVVDKATGAPIAHVCAFGHAGFSDGTETTPNCTGDDGKYVIGNLGPYHWPVEFVDGRERYVFQWSGGQPTQLTAKLLKVQVGQSVVENAQLVTSGTSISGRVTGKDGRAAPGTVTAFNAITGDLVARDGFIDQNGDYRINGVAGTQLVKLLYRDRSGKDLEIWYRDSPSFKQARPVLVRAGTPASGIDFVVP